MGVGNVFQTGRTGMMAAKAGIATSGHNITNSNTEGFSRQRVQVASETPRPGPGTGNYIGSGVRINRIERVNDEYIEKQIQNGSRDLSNLEEKDQSLRQVEDIFNEMNGEGLNRLMAKFFNEFRKLANDPNSQAVRESVREAAHAMVTDVHRLNKEVSEASRHIDAKIEGYVGQLNANTRELTELNQKIKEMEVGSNRTQIADLHDRRDLVVKNIASLVNVTTHKNEKGDINVEIRGVGPLVNNVTAEQMSVFRSPRDDEGKVENALDVKSTGQTGTLTHLLKGGKLGGLLEIRDQTLSSIGDRLDDLAYTLADTVNSIHKEGFSRDGVQGLMFFKPIAGKEGAAEMFDLSDSIKASSQAIATAAQPDSPADNRVAIAISGLQGMRLMADGKATVDDFYNSIVSDVGVISNKNRSTLNQQKNVMTQLNKMREQISGVSIDEETANLMQFQHSFDASARVIAVADEMVKTVLDLKRL